MKSAGGYSEAIASGNAVGSMRFYLCGMELRTFAANIYENKKNGKQIANEG